LDTRKTEFRVSDFRKRISAEGRFLFLRTAVLAFLFSVLNGCWPAPDADTYLVSEGSVALEISSLSGLSLGEDASSLWCVSDEPGSSLYRIRTNGEIEATVPWTGQDLEGVAWDRNRKVLWVVEEQRGELVGVDASGAELSRTAIPGGGGPGGLEGVAVDPETGGLYLLRERRPGLLIELDETLSVVESRELDFALDYSDVCFEPLNRDFWILSDREQAVFQAESPEGPFKKYKIDIVKPEGVAVDFVNRVIYIVSDSKKRLYYFALPG